jgi:hypothetical protein
MAESVDEAKKTQAAPTSQRIPATLTSRESQTLRENMADFHTGRCGSSPWDRESVTRMTMI